MAGWSAHRSVWIRALVHALALMAAPVLVVSLVQAPPVLAAPSRYEHLKPQVDPATPARSVPLTAAPTATTGRPYAPVAPVWPDAGTAEVDLAVPAAVGAGGSVRVAGLPVLLGRAVERGTDTGMASAASEVSRARVQVYGRGEALAAGVDGLLVRVARTDSVRSSARARVSVDYAGFASAYGADWSSRLRLVVLPECVLSTPELGSCRGTVLPSVHDAAARTVSADVLIVGESVSAGDGGEAGSAQGTLVALAAGTSSGAGDYAATQLQPSSSWSAGGNTGGFSWSYPVRVPPSLNGPAPKVTFGYSSQSVDGRMAASNNQPSWIGEGFEWSPGFVERRYKPCAKDMGSGANNTVKTGDLCWATDNATLSLNGSGNELLFKGGGEWRGRIDDGSRIQRRTGGGNGDNDGEYWVVTTSDGVQYWFGGRAGSNATWTVPVYGNHSGEPCYQPTFAASQCNGQPQAWRWNLDHVVDPRGNTMSYTYVKETNRYGRNNTPTDAVSYDRGGWLDRIEYGTRAGVAGAAPMRVQVSPADRCLTSCWSGPDAPVVANWPDTPWDQRCTGSPCYLGSPTFWTAKRLQKVTTQLWTGSGTTYSNVESWTLTHSFPDPGDGTRAGLWLQRISHTGHVGATTTVPDVMFAGVQMPNRVDATPDWAPPMNWWRIQYVTTETGGRVGVSYSPAQCVAGSVIPAQVHDNRLRCYPVKWVPEGYTDPVTDWFHKYVVTQVTEDDLALPAGERSDPVVTKYAYVGDPAWHYTDDDGLIAPEDKTWSVWRGYPAVRTTIGDPGEEQVSETRYFRGMHGDKQPTGTRSVTLPPVEAAPAVTDEDAWAGMARESIAFNGAAEVSATVSERWQSDPPNATRTINGTTVSARHVGTAATWTRTSLDNGRPARTTTTRTTFDSYGTAVKVDSTGDTAVTGDEQCTLTTYEPRNTTGWLTAFPHRVRGYATGCSTAESGPLTVDDIAADTRTWYDQATSHGTQPSKGLVSKVEELKTWTPGPGVAGTPGYLTTSTARHDGYGRVIEATDVRGNRTTTGYTHNLGGQLQTSTVTNHLGWATKTTLEPAWGTPTSTVDPNGRRADLSYDGLGRLVGVWLPGRDKAGEQTASMTFGYTVRNNGATAVTTAKLAPSGGYVASHALFDSLLRPRQTQAPEAYTTGGRVITDTVYDSAGRAWLGYGAHAADGAPSTSLYPLAAEATMPAVTRTLFDPAGRPTASIFLSMGVEKWRTTTGYGGDRTDVTPPAGGTATSTLIDAHDRTVELRQYHGTAPTPWVAGSFDATSSTYNRKGQLARVADPAGNQWTYTYDLRGRQIETRDPDKGLTRSTFNDAGDLTSATDSRGEVLAYTYDSLGRKTSLRDDTATGPKRAEWTYDTLADLTQVKGQPVKTIRWADPDNNGSPDAYTGEILGYNLDYTPTATTITIPTAETGLAGAYTYNHTYWPDGSPSTSRLPDVDGAGGLTAETLSYRYTPIGLPDTLGTNYGGIVNNTYVIGTTYTRYGEPTLTGRASSGVGLVEQRREYEEGSRRLVKVTTSRVTSPSGVADVRYSYDRVGNIIKISDATSADHQCFSYDQLRRLTEAWTPGNGDCNIAPSTAVLGGPAKYWSTWTFDKVGNRLAQTAYNPTSGSRDTTGYTYPAAGTAQPHTLRSTTGATTGSYTYDSMGNTRTRPTPSSGTQTLTWDAEGHLDTSTDSTGVTRYLYDPAGSRLIRRDPAGKTLYLPNQELRYTTGTGGKATSRYYTHNGETIAMRASAGLTWLVGDHQGTTSHAITATTQAVAVRRQTPYGTIRAATGTWPTGMTKGFVGGTNDNTGLTHLGAREYDPTIGRFTSVDPLIDHTDPQQMHGYSYANANPATLSDPDGLEPGSWCTDSACAVHNAQTQTSHPMVVGAARPTGGGGGGSAVGGGPGGGGRSTRSPALAAAEEAVRQAKQQLINAAKTLATIAMDELGITAALDCFADGDLGACAETALNVAASFVGGLAGKIATKYGAPWKWKKGAALVQRVWNVLGDLTSGVKAWWKNSRLAQRLARSSDTCPVPNSFIPGTAVVLADGTTKPIEDLEVGDVVLATDPETGQTAPKTVAATIIGQGSKHLVEITIDTDGEDGDASGVLIATDGHPFWVPDLNEWVDATDLQAGQWLQTSAGTWVQITALRRWTQTATVHNLTIADIHTYYVIAGNTPVLVHNTTCDYHQGKLGADETACGPACPQYRGQPEAPPDYSRPPSPPNPDQWQSRVGDPIEPPHPIATGGGGRKGILGKLLELGDRIGDALSGGG